MVRDRTQKNILLVIINQEKRVHWQKRNNYLKKLNS